ncbi:glycoside hydrolase family 2 TIM barrel-domain containing protein [Lachnospiraceae bacterium 46-15]
MKHRFNKLLAVVLAASMCVTVLPRGAAGASDNDGVSFTEPEVVKVSAVKEDRDTNFNEGWKFNLGDVSGAQNTGYNDASWKDVTIPHDFSIFQNFISSGEAESGYLPGGTGWYRKTFTLPESFEGKTILLNFDGVYSDAYVYVNGIQVGEHHYGYTAFAFDISDALACDGTTQNLIAVKAVNNIPSSRWYSGSGIYRDVTLVVTEPVHVDLNGTTVTTPEIENGGGKVRVEADIVNDGDSAKMVTVKNTVYTADGTAVSGAAETSVEVRGGETAAAVTEPMVAAPKLWSLDEPNMYYVRTEVLVDGNVTDTYDTDFGFRYFAFDHDTGFSLNGEKMKLNGVCMHHDQGALGSAAYYDAVYRQLSILKDMGVNAVRITHNPANKQYLEICNELGILAVEEFFDGWHIAKNGNTYDFARYFTRAIGSGNEIYGGNASMTWAEYALKSTVRRDRNNPSVIMWSLGNEIAEGNYVDSPDYPVHARNMIRWMQEEDTTRPATMGDNKKDSEYVYLPETNRVLNSSGGVVGFNYADYGTLASLHNNYNYIVASETASAVNSRGMYKTQLNGHGNESTYQRNYGYHLTSYDTSKVGWGKTAKESLWDTIRADYVAGQFVWTGFDYIGEPTPWNGTNAGDSGRGCVPNSSYFGIVETTGFPKDSYYLYRSQWNQKDTTLHLVTAWDADNIMYSSGNKTPVWVYTNAPVIKLYRNGTLIGTASRTEVRTAAGYKYYTYQSSSNDAACTAVQTSGSESLFAIFNVEYASGTISAKAFEQDGTTEISQVAGNASVSTPGTAARLQVTEKKDEIAADGSSLVHIAVDVTDANGVLDTTASNEINFSLTGNGEIVGVDNGDQATVDKYQQESVLTGPASAKIKAYAGKALVIVRSTKTAGSFTLTASASGLQNASVTVNTVKEEEGGTVENTIESYKMVKHCYAPKGIPDITLPGTVEAAYTDGSTKTLTITWEDFDKTKLGKAGVFPINGSIQDGGQTISLFLTVHVYGEVSGVRNFSLCTRPGAVPVLPTMAMTYDEEGNAFEEYPVQWDMGGITEASFANVGDIITINGAVEVRENVYSTKASVRVAEGTVDSEKNVATGKLHLADNGPYSDVLSSIVDGVRGDNGPESRWTTWGKYDAGEHVDEVTISMDWATAVTTNRINLFFFKDEKAAGSALPTSVEFEYALGSEWDAASGTISADWKKIEYKGQEAIILSATENPYGFTQGFSYELAENINPVAVRIKFKYSDGTFIGLNEVEVISTTYTYQPNTSAELSGVTACGKEVAFDDTSKTYEVYAGFPEEIEFDNPENASVTFLQVSADIVKALVISEDGRATKTYTMKLTNLPTTASKNALQSKLAEYKNIDSSLYTPESYAVFQKLIEDMEAAIDKMSESRLQDNLAALNDAFANLKKVSDKEPDTEPSTEPDSEPGTEPSTNPDTQPGTEPSTNPGTEPSTEPGHQKPPAGSQDTELKKNQVVTVGAAKYKVLDPVKKTAELIKADTKKSGKYTVSTVMLNGKKYTVIAIAANGFKGAGKLTSVSIGSNVASIGKNAFAGCKKLKSIVIGRKVKSIGAGAFAGCKKLGSVKFQGTAVKKIGKKAFTGTAKKITVKVPKKLKKNKNFKKKLTKAGMSKKVKIR